MDKRKKRMEPISEGPFINGIHHLSNIFIVMDGIVIIGIDTGENVKEKLIII